MSPYFGPPVVSSAPADVVHTKAPAARLSAAPDDTHGKRFTFMVIPPVMPAIMAFALRSGLAIVPTRFAYSQVGRARGWSDLMGMQGLPGDCVAGDARLRCCVHFQEGGAAMMWRKPK